TWNNKELNPKPQVRTGRCAMASRCLRTLEVISETGRALPSYRTTQSAVLLRNATPSVLHQRHIGRVLRSSCNDRGRRLASSRARELRPGRCPPLWPGDLRNDGGSVAAAGADGSAA